MAYAPTHNAPEGGLPAYAAPDQTQAAVAQLDAGLDVQLLERRADWAHIACSNGWTAWVDARRLVARATPAPTSAPPPPAAAPSPAPTPGPAPSPAPIPAPASGATVAPTGGGLKLGLGQILALAGAALVLLSGWLNWVDFDLAGQTFSASAYKVPAYILIDNTVSIPSGGVNLGILVFLAAAACVVGALVRPVRWLPLVGGGLAVVVAVVYLIQVSLLVGDLDDAGIDAGLFDLAGFAPVLAVMGGIAAVVGGALALVQKR